LPCRFSQVDEIGRPGLEVDLSKLQGPVMKLLLSTNLGVDELRELYPTAGYTDVQTFEERTKGWFCGVGRKAL
jgi:hypothetical protein